MDNFRIIQETLSGERPADEQTQAAVAILAERLQRLQQNSRLFAGVAFSPHVRTLRRQAEALVMG